MNSNPIVQGSDSRNSDSQESFVEIKFVDIVNFFKRNFLIFMIVGVLAGVSGYSFSFLFKETYRVETLLLPELDGFNAGQSGSLSSMLRMSNIGQNVEAIRPDLYPNVLSTSPFALYMLAVPVTDSHGKKYARLSDYIASGAKPGLISRLFPPNAVQAKAPIKVSGDILNIDSQEQGKINWILASVTADYNLKTGVITISSEMNDPIVAAETAAASARYLINYMTEYRLGKNVDRVKFLEDQVKEAERKKMDAEYSLSTFRDRHRNPFLNTSRVDEQRLLGDVTISSNLYYDLAAQLEQAKLKEKEGKPVLKVLEPSKVPLSKNKPRRMSFALVSVLFCEILLFIYLLFFRKRSVY